MEGETYSKLSIKKKKSDQPIYFGIDIETGELLSVKDVARGRACSCICSSCSTKLVARKGEIKKHHFAHEINKECLYGSEISVYRAFYELLRKSEHFFLPDAILSFHSYKKDEIVNRGNLIALTDVAFHNDLINYPPELLCYCGSNCFQIILNIEGYYNESDCRELKEYGKQRNIPIVSVAIDKLDDLSDFSKLQPYIDTPAHKVWIYNRIVDKWDRKFREVADAPAAFESGHLCLAQKNQYKNVYSAKMEDCMHCRYCYDYTLEKFCLAHKYIDHIEDFGRTEEERKQIFAKINKLKPIKKITEFSCPRCGAPMKRRTGPNGIFAGCSNYPQCRGTRQVEQTTEQVIVYELRKYY